MLLLFLNCVTAVSTTSGMKAEEEMSEREISQVGQIKSNLYVRLHTTSGLVRKHVFLEFG